MATDGEGQRFGPDSLAMHRCSVRTQTGVWLISVSDLGCSFGFFLSFHAYSSSCPLRRIAFQGETSFTDITTRKQQPPSVAPHRALAVTEKKIPENKQIDLRATFESSLRLQPFFWGGIKRKVVRIHKKEKGQATLFFFAPFEELSTEGNRVPKSCGEGLM